jgi:hypothetical protein
MEKIDVLTFPAQNRRGFGLRREPQFDDFRGVAQPDASVHGLPDREGCFLRFALSRYGQLTTNSPSRREVSDTVFDTFLKLHYDGLYQFFVMSELRSNRRSHPPAQSAVAARFNGRKAIEITGHNFGEIESISKAGATRSGCRIFRPWDWAFYFLFAFFFQLIRNEAPAAMMAAGGFKSQHSENELETVP